jgi:hypothetical protein
MESRHFALPWGRLRGKVSTSKGDVPYAPRGSLAVQPTMITHWIVRPGRGARESTAVQRRGRLI